MHILDGRKAVPGFFYPFTTRSEMMTATSSAVDIPASHAKAGFFCPVVIQAKMNPSTETLKIKRNHNNSVIFPLGNQT